MRRQGREHIARALPLQYSGTLRKIDPLIRATPSSFSVSALCSQNTGAKGHIAWASPSQNTGTLPVIVPLVRATPSHPLLPCTSRKGAHSSGSALTKYRRFGQDSPHTFFFRALRARGAIACAQLKRMIFQHLPVRFKKKSGCNGTAWRR
jgi:hypothetical protein